MAKIKDIYKNDEYGSFLYFCEEHGYFDMTDLAGCQFQDLRLEADITPSILSKIKTTFLLYCKTHPREFSPRGAAVRKPGKSTVPEAEIEEELEAFFAGNANKLIKITEISKSVGKKAKRSDLLRILEHAPWCKAVDSTTFFYSPETK
ncbi:MAG TPA: hypothetical protein VHO71_02160 [Caproiciproducens sp.]|nr:hypothetical protein [Caproiciproducens sp.]